MNTFLQSLRNLGPARLAAMVGVAVGVVGFFIYLTARLSTPNLELLYGELDAGDAAQVAGRLESQKIPYEVRGGNQIFVPSDQVAKVRLQLAEHAIPSGGSVGYEVFDKTDQLSSTNFMQNLNMVRALEGELARTIKSISGVKSARVHLVLPKREMFTRDMQQPSASIVLKMGGAGRLSKPQVMAVQHLVAAAVPRLKPERISIVDDKGTLLARGFENSAELAAVNAEEMRLATEGRLARTVEAMLERSVGAGKVRAEVNVEMDFDRIVSNEEKYDPDGQVVRSTQTVTEKSASADGESGSVSVAQNLPDAQSASGGRSSNSEQRSQETVNFEISKKTINLIREQGVVKRMSVAVLIDGTRTEGQYQPRGKEEMDQLAALVRSAVGFDAKRGDTVEVINLAFAAAEEAPADSAPWMPFGLEKNDLLKMAEVLVLSVVAILVILLVVRPLVTRAFEALPAAGEAMGRKLLGEPAVATAALAGPGGPMPTGPALAVPEEEEVGLDELIDIDKVEGRVKASSIKKISEIVDKHPEEALSIVRAWMYQEQ